MREGWESRASQDGLPYRHDSHHDQRQSEHDSTESDAKFTSIAEDGKIGAATVTAMQKAGNAALDVLPIGVKEVAKQIFGSSLTKENVAANAAELTSSLNTAADKLEAQGGLPAPIVSVPAVVLPNNSGGGAASIPVAPASSSSGSSIATAVVMKRRKQAPAAKRRAAGGHAHAY